MPDNKKVKTQTEETKNTDKLYTIEVAEDSFNRLTKKDQEHIIDLDRLITNSKNGEMFFKNHKMSKSEIKDYVNRVNRAGASKATNADVLAIYNYLGRKELGDPITELQWRMLMQEKIVDSKLVSISRLQALAKELEKTGDLSPKGYDALLDKDNFLNLSKKDISDVDVELKDKVQEAQKKVAKGYEKITEEANRGKDKANENSAPEAKNSKMKLEVVNPRKHAPKKSNIKHSKESK